ncbi:serine dehydratase [Alkalicella caledoniensis]|uniref:Serine dehydratase n=1 Tax=Alkalicella caledoniensis TaxID=2731377 RepID=A0A7G9WB30_ALKCA|nr:serine dehydratase [Alkalicella caledoniensis]QNO15892.1 serine dehydratase [Alkalicella caledoniensis]
MELKRLIEEKLPLTIGETIEIAHSEGVRVVDVVLAEAELTTGKSKEEILQQSYEQFAHNLKAVEIGLETGHSLLLGSTGAQLHKIEGNALFEDGFIDKVLKYTIAAQVGNHEIGLNPCAGTGDSCPYTGFIKALEETGGSKEEVCETTALILKIGSMFRVGKVTTGCNMEGFGAGAAAIAAAMVHVKCGTPKDMERAMVLSISPTIAVPCTPRVMVPALCATHIGGAILIGSLAASLTTKTDIEVNVPIDVMLAMATEIHPVSAKHIVPMVNDYMRPFFKTKPQVEKLIDQEIKDLEQENISKTLQRSKEVAKKLAHGAKPINQTLGVAVVGGSSQAVGSPTNTGRIAHYLSKGQIKKVKIELYGELFDRRGINIPGTLMGAVFGASTNDYKMYRQVMESVERLGIEVEIIRAEEHQVQRVTIETNEGTFMVDALNRGGGRLVLRKATPSVQRAAEIAEELSIVLAEE